MTDKRPKKRPLRWCLFSGFTFFLGVAIGWVACLLWNGQVAVPLVKPGQDLSGSGQESPKKVAEKQDWLNLSQEKISSWLSEIRRLRRDRKEVRGELQEKIRECKLAYQIYRNNGVPLDDPKVKSEVDRMVKYKKDLKKINKEIEALEGMDERLQKLWENKQESPYEKLGSNDKEFIRQVDKAVRFEEIVNEENIFKPRRVNPNELMDYSGTSSPGDAQSN